MKTLELFCGTKSFSNVAEQYGYETFTLDNSPLFNATLTIDILDFDIDMLNGYKPDIIWASPPCTKFSIAAVYRNWDYDGSSYIPKNADTKEALDIMLKTWDIILLLKPKYYYIENPRAMLRKTEIFPDPFNTVTYCQYGFTNMKPTDIWHNNPKWGDVAKSCKNGMKCHEAAPRGSRTGTQGIKNAKDRGKIPPKLIEDILNYSK